MVGTSTSEDEGLAVEAVKLGAVDYFRKPFEVDEVLTVVRRSIATLALEREDEQLRGEVILYTLLRYGRGSAARALWAPPFYAWVALGLAAAVVLQALFVAEFGLLPGAAESDEAVIAASRRIYSLLCSGR